MEDSFDSLVDRLEDIREAQGRAVCDDDRTKRVSYEQDGAIFTFDLHKRRLEITFRSSDARELVNWAHQVQLGIGRESPMLAAPPEAPMLGRTPVTRRVPAKTRRGDRETR